MLGNLKEYRSLFVGLEEFVPLWNGRKVVGVNFDNAATTPPFKSVLRNVVEFSGWYSSIHRGKGYKSKICDDFYEKARNTILRFLEASSRNYNVIYVKNTTEGINKLAYRLIDCKDGLILSTRMEHHSNDLPWRDKCSVEYVEVDERGRLSLEQLISKLKEHRGRVKLLALSGASNVTGIVNDINLIASICHSYGCKIMVDGAQLVPHRKIYLEGFSHDDYIDYLVFSAHKMYAPFGIGIVVVPKNCFIDGEPEYKGGGTVKFVTDDDVIWDDPPHKEEAGTPNFMGIVALLTAIKELQAIGMEEIQLREEILTEYIIKELRKIPKVILYGDNDNVKNKVGIVSFNIDDIYHEEVADSLSQDFGISVRNGCFCAQPYVKRLLGLTDKEVRDYINNPHYKKPGMVRVSLGLYNNKEEVDYFLNAVDLIASRRVRGNYF